MPDKIEPWKRYSEESWIIEVHEYQCPDCCTEVLLRYNPEVEEYNYCPYCGAKRTEQDGK